MAKKILYSDFVDTETIISSMITSSELQRAIKRKTLFNMWTKIIGNKFAQKSKPYSLSGRTMIIACKNSVIAQELQLQKQQIIKKAEPYLKALKIKINDMKFDTKRWVD
jgi:predicted nucleic acid-binding Zn ribbon protein